MATGYVRPGTPCSDEHVVTTGRRLDYIVANCCNLPSAKILDIGAGSGIYASSLRELALEYVGIDINRESLRKARIDNRTCDFLLMNAERTAFRDESYDYVLLIEVIEHIVRDRDAISEVGRILKPAGKLIITAPSRLCMFETHGMRIGARIFGTKGFGIPFLPYMPESLRCRIANARVYTPRQLKSLLGEQFSVTSLDYLAPSLDQIVHYFPDTTAIMRPVQSLLDRFENSAVLRLGMPTMIAVAEKKSV